MTLEPMYPGKVNSPATFLAKNITLEDTKLEVIDPSVLPEAPNLLCLGTGKNTETILYNKIEGNIISDCKRGFQGEAKAWDKMTIVARIITEYDFGSLQRNLKNHAEDNTMHIGIGNITTEAIANHSITAEKLSEDVNFDIKDGSITTEKIKDGNITTDKIANHSITAEKLSEDVNFDIKDGSITTDKIADKSITKAKLSEDITFGSDIKDGSITTAKLANNCVTADKINNVKYLSKHVVIGEGANVTTSSNTDVLESAPCVALGNNTNASGNQSTALGASTTASGNNSIALGYSAKASNSYTIAIGYSSKASNSYAIAIGRGATASHDYSTALGYNATTTTSSQIMLGNSATTPYAYRSLVVTSDKRDKTDIKDIDFNSLDFLNKLKPKQYKMDYRSNYKRDEEISKEEYEKLDEYTKKSHTTKYPIYELENGFRYINYHDYVDKNITKDSDRYKPILKTKDIFLSKETAETELKKKFKKDIGEFEEKQVGEIILKEVFLESDGSMSGERYHNGFLAQEVEDVAKSMNFDFAGVKYLAHNGDGEDMYGLAYEEFIAPIIGGIQELSKENDNLNNKINELEAKLKELETKLN